MAPPSFTVKLLDAQQMTLRERIAAEVRFAEQLQQHLENPPNLEMAMAPKGAGQSNLPGQRPMSAAAGAMESSVMQSAMHRATECVRADQVLPPQAHFQLTWQNPQSA